MDADIDFDELLADAEHEDELYDEYQDDIEAELAMEAEVMLQLYVNARRLLRVQVRRYCHQQAAGGLPNVDDYIRIGERATSHDLIVAIWCAVLYKWIVCFSTRTSGECMVDSPKLNYKHEHGTNESLMELQLTHELQKSH